MTEPTQIDDGRWLLPDAACPACGASVNAAGTLQNDPDPPKPDDLTVCAECGTILQFDPLLRPVLADPVKFAMARMEDAAAVHALEVFSARVAARRLAITNPLRRR